MGSFKMKGVIPPMITPFDRQGNIDEESLIKLVKFLNERVHGVFICGSYGSGALMSLEERKKVAETVKQHARGLQVIAMTGTTNTRDTIELSLHAKDIGCDAVSAIAPYYFHHNMDDLVIYYQDLIEAIGNDYPVYIYVNPKFSGYEVDLKTLGRLKEIGLKGIKAASFDIMVFANYMRELADENFDVVLGTEALWLAASVYGAQSFIPGLANAFPEICTQMYDESMVKDYESCLKTQYKVNRIRDVMYLSKSTQLAVYTMLELRGIAMCYPRKPFTAASEEEKEAIKAQLQLLGMI